MFIKINPIIITDQATKEDQPQIFARYTNPKIGPLKRSIYINLNTAVYIRVVDAQEDIKQIIDGVIFDSEEIVISKGTPAIMFWFNVDADTSQNMLYNSAFYFKEPALEEYERIKKIIEAQVIT